MDANDIDQHENKPTFPEKEPTVKLFLIFIIRIKHL